MQCIYVTRVSIIRKGIQPEDNIEDLWGLGLGEESFLR
jgi:hypothetical protein